MTGSPAAGVALAADNLTRFFGERAALDRVSFSLAAGQTLVVLGANGAGKSTLLRIISTLLRPSEGRVQVLGHDLPSAAWAVRGAIGLVAHEPLVYRDLTVRENLEFIARLYGAPTADVDQLLERVELSGRGSDPAFELSKGMLQRLAVARALIGRPQLLLLDEPRANLDPHAVSVLEPLIGRDSGRTRVIVTHDTRFALEQADLILGLRGGRSLLLKPAGAIGERDLAELYA